LQELYRQSEVLFAKLQAFRGAVKRSATDQIREEAEWYDATNESP
jgi:hypothetical protein